MCILGGTLGAYKPQLPGHGAAFYANFLDRFKTTGAIAPSSRFLAKSMIRKLKEEVVLGQPLYILEVGAGDGVFTAAIAEYCERKGIDYRLYAVDIDATFLAALKERFADNSKVQIWNADILKTKSPCYFHLPRGKRFDVIISGLPFYADFFSAADVATIFENYKTLASDGALLRWFSYVAAPTLVDVQYAYQRAKSTIPLVANLFRQYLIQQSVDVDQQRLDETKRLFDQKSVALRKKCSVIDAFKVENDVVSSRPILNIPLARVHECRLFDPSRVGRRAPHRSRLTNASNSSLTMAK